MSAARASSPRLRPVEPVVAERMRQEVLGETDETLTAQFGISYITQRKIRSGQAIRASVASRIEARLREANGSALLGRKLGCGSWSEATRDQQQQLKSARLKAEIESAGAWLYFGVPSGSQRYPLSRPQSLDTTIYRFVQLSTL